MDVFMACRRCMPGLTLGPILVSAAFVAAPASADGPSVRRLLSVEVSQAQQMVQQTPIDTRDGYLYTANIEPGPNGDSDDTTLRTVLRQGKRGWDGRFDWTSVELESRTMADPYHTAPAIGIDRGGHVHVAYNMHNTPWQYARSEEPHDIRSIAFRGQVMTRELIDRAFYANKTSFPTLGTGEIPGNLVTYPAFVRDRTGELHVSYRFAARPARGFTERTFSGGVARYDLASRSWRAIGGAETLSENDFDPRPDVPSESISIAGQQHWTVYHPDLAFDSANRLHATFFWRPGRGGGDLSRPCHVIVQADGTFIDAKGRTLDPPLRPSDCGNMGFSDWRSFYTIAAFKTSNAGVPHALLSPRGESRQILRLEGTTWVREPAPYGATEIFFDADDTLYAIASGLRILRRRAGDVDWELIHRTPGGGDCYPRAVVDEEKRNAYIHTQSCDLERVNIYAIDL